MPKGESYMRKLIAAALAATLALSLCACGRRLPFQRADPATAAVGRTERQEPPATVAPASRKAAASAPVIDGSATTAPASTPAPTKPAVTTEPVAATQAAATTQAITTTAVPTTLPRPFGGAEIVLGGPNRSLDEELSKNPHTVYALDMNGRRFDFQPRAYTGGSFAVDVYLDNRDGSFTKLDTFTCANPGVDGKYSIVLVTPASTVTRDERQKLTLVENVYRFELSPAAERYAVRMQASHAPYPATVYYALDMNRAGGFVRFIP